MADGTLLVDNDFGSSDSFASHDMQLDVTPLTTTVAGLLPSLSYTFRMRAYNEIKGNRTVGPWSDEKQIMTREVCY